MACKKDKDPRTPSEEPETPLAPEVITTLQFYVWDSLTNTAVPGSPFTFKDIDGEGGQPGLFLNGGADSLITLNAGKTYITRVVILDETASPVDSISNAVGGDESYEHMLFYNGDPANNANNKGNAILNPALSAYTVKLNGSGITIRYNDTDNGAAHNQAIRPVGLSTLLKTGTFTGNVTYPFIVTLRHQPDAKDGSYTPGETDIEVGFKVRVN